MEQVLPLVAEQRIKLPRAGTRKLHFLLKNRFAERKLKVGRDKLFSLLRAEHLLIRPLRSYTKTTNSKHWLKKHPNLVEQLPVVRPEQVWVSDITYISTRKGFSYLSLVTDAYSKKIMGYCLAEDLRTEGPLRALEMATKQIKYKQELIHHSDRGLQYCSEPYQQLLRKHDIKASMTQSYDPYQNAVAERVNGILKAEFILQQPADHQQAERLVKEAIDAYNNLRPHLSCHYLTPQQMHQQNILLPITYKKSTLPAAAGRVLFL